MAAATTVVDETDIGVLSLEQGVGEIELDRYQDSYNGSFARSWPSTKAANIHDRVHRQAISTVRACGLLRVSGTILSVSGLVARIPAQR
jgi:hypothetical protein